MRDNQEIDSLDTMLSQRHGKKYTFIYKHAEGRQKSEVSTQEKELRG